MKKVILISLSIMALSFYSCKEDSETPEIPKTKTELLCASAWKYFSATITPGIEINGVMTNNLFEGADPCDLDDLEIYKSDGTGSFDDGPTKCDPSDPQSDPFTWKFNTTETTLTIDPDDVYDIVTLDANTMVVTQVLDGDNVGGTSGVNYTLTYTYKH